MHFKIKEFSRLTGVSLQALRHYDEIGLLVPTRLSSNRYRVYGEDDFLKLQHIKALQFFGFSLRAISELLSQDKDAYHHFKAQSQLLEEKAHNMLKASQTLKNILADWKEPLPWKKALNLMEIYTMPPLKTYDKDSSQQKRYEKYLLDHGVTTKAVLERSASSLPPADMDLLYQKLASAFVRGLGPAHDDIQDLMRQHYAMVCQFWIPTRESYKGLAQLYRDHEDFRALYESYAPGFTSFLGAAMEAFADAQLDGTS